MSHFDESWLDDMTHLARCDSRDTLRALATAGAQVRESLVLAREAGIESVGGGERPRAVLVGALGGSSTVADVLEVLAQAHSPVPVTTRHDAPLPGWVGPLDLVVAVSMSGRAAGPIALAAEAARRGASLLTVGAANSPLAEICASARGIHVPVGRGRVSSRTALWSLLVPVLLGAHELGLVSVDEGELREAADALDAESEANRPSSEHFVNPAKLGALTLAGTVPMAFADSPLAGVAARRAARMFAASARVPMTWAELPDDVAGLISTFDGPFTAGGGEGAPNAPDDIFADPFLDAPSQPNLGLLSLRSQTGDASANLIEEMARNAGAKLVEVRTEGRPITQLATLIQRVDFTATYLALGQGIDPSVSRHLTALRDDLARREGR